MHQPTQTELQEILAHFCTEGQVKAIRPYGSGHINDTFLVETQEAPNYILQRVSSACFPRPVEVMENVCGVTGFLREAVLAAHGDADRETLTLLPTKENGYWFVDADGDCWRVYLNIANTRTYQLPENADIFRKAGQAFGKFQMMLADYPAETLHETIPHFHDTVSRVEALRQAIREDRAGRAQGVQPEIEFALTRAEKAGALVNMLAAGELPLRVTHNDTKLNNVLMDAETGDGVCVIDLDTVMPGLCAYDFGDAIRFGANTAEEDEADVSKIHFSLPMFKAYAEGYLKEAGSALSEAEVRSLPLGAWMMTYEVGIRFLTDYLNGDVYFHVAYPEHNLVRARNQFALLADMEKNKEAMDEAVASVMEGNRRMKEPILVIMAAGMGSRYGGLKQMDPVGPDGEVILDYSIFDARRAGFKRVVFLIKHEIEEDFKRLVGDHIAQHMEVRYAFQQLDKLPEGYAVPEGRTKPWGTGHAVLCCKELIDAPFAVINADDYYGSDCFKLAYHALRNMQDDDKHRYMMVGYQLHNTLTDNGHVARGVCTVKDGYLEAVQERTHIIKTVDGALYTEDEQTYHKLPEDTLVSMNLWGFTPSILDALTEDFPAFLDKALAENPQKAEFFLPTVVSHQLAKDTATVQVLPSPDKWYGVTYQADKPVVKSALRCFAEEGLYPMPLWK